MPVDTQHPSYREYQEQWQKCIDTYMGDVAIKAAKTRYLPQLSKQTPDEYDAYLKRAMFAPFMARTVQGLAGAAVYKNFKVELPENLKHLENDATNTEMGLHSFIKQGITGLLSTGRIGILVDRGKKEETPPYLVYYTAQQVINWREDAGQLTLVVLEEESEEYDANDVYSSKMKKVWRVLLLKDGVYTQELYEKSPDGKTFILLDTAIPTNRGKSFDYIPFVFSNAYGIGTAVDKPPLYDLATVNLSHYCNSADLEHGRHFTGLPMLFIAGINSDQELKLGSSTALIVGDAAAHGEYIEFTGQGLSTLEKALESKAALMAVLGARLLESQRPGVEAEGTVRMRQMGDIFTLSSLNMSLADALSKALGFASQWAGGDGEVEVEPNTDFSDAAIDPQEITALMALWQAGGISLDTLLFNLKRGEKLPPDTEIDDEISLIDLQQARLNSLPALSPDEKAVLKTKKFKKQNSE